MTTIAYRSGFMAGDSLVSDKATGFKLETSHRKVAVDASGVLYGVAGDYAASCRVIAAIEEQRQTGKAVMLPIPLKDDDFEIMVAYPDGRIRVLTPHGEENYDSQPYMAIGNGAQVALGAMFAGAGAGVAVEAAVKHSTGTGGAVFQVEGVPFEGAAERAARFDSEALESSISELPHPLSKTPGWKKPEPLDLAETPEQEFDRIAREG